VSDPGQAAFTQKLAQVRQDLRRDLAVLEAIRASIEASLRNFRFAERAARGMGLREASLVAEQDLEEAEHIGQLQGESNDAFRNIKQYLDEICHQIDSMTEVITNLEEQIPTA
jgi:hypothetical protein